MISISLLAAEITKIDQLLRDGGAVDEQRAAFLRGAVEALRWTMFPDVTPAPSNAAAPGPAGTVR